MLTLDVEMREADGAPLRDFAVSCCGRDLCVYSRTGADGRAQVRVCHTIDAPAFKVLGGRELVSFAAPLRAGEAVSVPPVKATRLPRAGVAFPAAGQGATLASGGVSLDLSATTKVTISELEHPDPEDKLFRAASIAPDGVPDGLVPPGLRFDLLFGFAPMSATFDPPAPMTFPNTLGWPAGTRVAVYVHGVEIDDAVAPYGGWREHGSAAVTSDGTSIRADGVPALTIVGLSRR